MSVLALFLTGCGSSKEPEIDVEVDLVQISELPELTVYHYEGHYYSLLTNKMNWISAERTCESLGGHLATVTSAEENAACKKILTKEGIANTQTTPVWLGAENLMSLDYSWRWVTGENFSYTHWLGGEPNNCGASGKEHYMCWDAVDGASAYEVKLSQDSLPVSVNTNSFDVSYSRAGTYAISVAAKGDNMTVADGEKLTFNQVVRNITAPVKDSTFTIERVGDEVMIQMNGNELATAYVLYVGGALAQMNQTGVFYYTVTPESLSYSFQVAYLGGKFGSDGNYYIDSNKSAEVIINY